MIQFLTFTILSFSFFSSNLALAKQKSLGISIGNQAPAFSVKDIKGEAFKLEDEIKKGEVVLVFYRGGWCPYCNIQLRSLQAEVLPVVKVKKAQLVVVSVDKVDEALKTQKKEDLGMRVVSDSQAKLIKKYNVAYKVPEDLVKKYKKSYKIDLEKSSGKQHHIIAVPAVFIIDKQGKITFSYVNENYKVRAQVEDIIKALN